MLGSVVSELVRLVELGGSVVGVRHGTEEPRKCFCKAPACQHRCEGHSALRAPVR